MATSMTAETDPRLSTLPSAIRDRWHCMNHPFYDRLAEGTLDLRHLACFLVQHSLLVRQSFRSIGVTYAKSPDDIAHFIVENLAEEAGLIGIDGGPKGTALVPGLYMFREAFQNGYMGYACAIGFVLFLFILVLTELNNRYVRVEK